MVLKSKEKQTHLADHTATFDVLWKYKMKLNASKCTFGIGSSKFLGYIVNHHGIEENSKQIKTTMELDSPRSVKEVQKLMGMVTGLNRFISRSSDRYRPFFQTFRQGKSFKWTSKCQSALEGLKTYLGSVPLLSTPMQGDILILYLVVSDHCHDLSSPL